MSRVDLKQLANTYRPIPFWSWNDKLEPEELRRQIREMHAVGLGGFFMHARGGLQTAYLSPEWMACVEACIDEAQKCGMYAWIYDENGWPSGFGGGLVNALGVKYQQKFLRILETNAADIPADVAEHAIAYYSADDAKELLGRSVPEGFTGRILAMYYEINPYYVDNMDIDVVHEFIRVTHQYYYDALPKNLLSHMKGIFTDEPQLSRHGLPWSFVLEAEYKREYGLDLLPELPKLIFDLPNCKAFRVRFWRLVSKLFRDHYIKPIGEWCDAHGWTATGHHLLEESLEWLVISNGSMMPQYQYFTIPGIDHLGRSLASDVTLVQLDSAASQFGKKQRIAENFACTGWNCNLTGQRYVFQWEQAHGVNLLCEHLESYSLRGLRKRDYPASAFYHQPWWGTDYRVHNDYVTRVSAILTEGTWNCKTLVVHPMSSVWAMFRGDTLDDQTFYDIPVEHRKKQRYYEEFLEDFSWALDTHLIPHHYLDEIIAEDIASCEHGELVVGACRYSVVIIPPVTNLSRQIYELLRVFQTSGGTILRVANELEPDTLTLDGEPAGTDDLAWFTSLPTFEDIATTVAAVARLLPDRVRVTEKTPQTEPIVGTWNLKNIPVVLPEEDTGEHPAQTIVGTYRMVDDLNGMRGRVDFLSNTQYEQSACVHISLPKAGEQLLVLNAYTGDLEQWPNAVFTPDRVEFDFYFGGADSVVFFQPETANDALPVTQDARMKMQAPAMKAVSNTMCFVSGSENILTLDQCRCRVDGGEWKSRPIISLQAELLRLHHDADVDLEIPFQIGADFDLQTPMALIVETPEKFRFSLNGTPFDAVVDPDYKFDKAFQRVPLPMNLRYGENVIGMSLRYHQDDSLWTALDAAAKFETEYNKLTYDTEIESVYLVGPFQVRFMGETETLPRHAIRYNGLFELAPDNMGQMVDCTDITTHAGMMFFAGQASFETTVTLTAEDVARISALRFKPSGANSWDVTINGKKAGTLLWEPYILPVKGLLKEGENVIVFTMVTSLRNMLGPHHLEEGESYGIGTLSFNIEPDFVGYPAPKTVPGFCSVIHAIREIELVE